MSKRRPVVVAVFAALLVWASVGDAGTEGAGRVWIGFGLVSTGLFVFAVLWVLGTTAENVAAIRRSIDTAR